MSKQSQKKRKEIERAPPRPSSRPCLRATAKPSCSTAVYASAHPGSSSPVASRQTLAHRRPLGGPTSTTRPELGARCRRSSTSRCAPRRSAPAPREPPLAPRRGAHARPPSRFLGSPPSSRPLTSRPFPPSRSVLPHHAPPFHLHVHVRQDEGASAHGSLPHRPSRALMESRAHRRAPLPLGLRLVSRLRRAHLLGRRRQVSAPSARVSSHPFLVRRISNPRSASAARASLSWTPLASVVDRSATGPPCRRPRMPPRRRRRS